MNCPDCKFRKEGERCLQRDFVKRAINRLKTLTIKKEEITCECKSCSEERYLLSKLEELEKRLNL